MKKLVIVESPSKTKTITKYLGKEYKVVSSMGHIRDLATSGKYGFGVDTENDFIASYVPIKGKSKIITALKKDAKDSDLVYLATDPDREGEAISWHLLDSLDLKEDKYERIIFNEITEKAVLEAIKNPRKIDNNLVKSQETRRILDRIIGFRLSKLIQSKTGGKSAGRVQSVALKLIVEREREILAFIPEEYWEIEAVFTDFKAMLEKYHGKKIEIHGEKEANDILDSLDKSFTIEEIKETPKNKKGVMPLITSTLQQMASTRLGFGSSKTMRVAQKLYEGIDIGSETVGLITYMRTDSTRFSNEFVKDAFTYIKKKYGEEYVGSVKVSKKKTNVQDAHEAIRPTSLMREPDKIKEYLTPDEYKLYKMIYIRSLASLMKDAKVLATSISLLNNGYEFKATGQVLTFDGYLKVYKEYEKSEDVILPNFKDYKSNVLIAKEINKSQHFTKPAARYTEASLINELEKLGIGRPSTYASIMEKIKERDYVLTVDKKFQPTEMGMEITDKLEEGFSHIINVEYTAKMETDLDEIAENKLDNVKVLKDFYEEFEPMVQKSFETIEKKAPVTTGESCPECGGDLVIRKGKYGEFTACSNYPKCKYIKKEPREVKEIIDCPKCDGKVVEKITRKGKIFYGCSNYPKCDFASWDLPIKEKCPECGGTLTIKKDKTKCLDCKYEK
jgi:DNA topoisomerase-1